VTPPTRPTLPLSRIKLGQRFRRDLGNIDALTDSIREVGLLHPIVVDADGNLIAGQRRLAACHLLGMKDIPVTIVELDDAGRLRAEQDENITPKSFTPSEAVAIAAAIKDRVKTPHGGDRKTSESRGKVSTLNPGKTRDKAAEFVGMSGRTLEKATAVVEAAAADPELEHVVDEMDRTGKVDPAYRKITATRTSSPQVDEETGIPDRHQVEFSNMLCEITIILDGALALIDTSVIIPTTRQKKQLAHILHALGKVRRTVEQNAVTAKAFGTGPDDRIPDGPSLVTPPTPTTSTPATM